MEEFSMRLSRRCSAHPDVVYDILADLPPHLTWGGRQQRSDFRLLSLDAPRDPATVGTTFTNTGAIPMSARRWDDVSTVTVAVRPVTFEFVTHATVHRPPAVEGEQCLHAAGRVEFVPPPGAAGDQDYDMARGNTIPGRARLSELAGDGRADRQPAYPRCMLTQLCFVEKWDDGLGKRRANVDLVVR